MHQPLLPYTPERDAYRLLGVSSSATTDEISAACRRLARTFHPDRNRSERATAEMQVVNAVRQVMSDPDTRAVYDRERYRFHTVVSRAAERPAPSWPASSTPRLSGMSPMQRYLRATVAGLSVALAGLVPARCPGCRAVFAGEDAYCPACGTPRLGEG